MIFLLHQKLDEGRSFEVNKRIVYSVRSLGIGYTGRYGKVQRFDKYATSSDQK